MNDLHSLTDKAEITVLLNLLLHVQSVVFCVY